MVTCEIGSLLNPGLSATWVRAILEPPGIASTVWPNLKAKYGIEITKNTLMSRYGILIADLWDKRVGTRPTERSCTQHEHGRAGRPWRRALFSV